MSRFNLIALLAAFGLSMAAPTLSLAQDDGPPPPRHEKNEKGGKECKECKEKGEHGHPMMERIMKQLFDGIKLDDDQKAALKKIHEDNREKHQAFMKEHKDEMKKFGDSMKAWHEDNKDKMQGLRKAMQAAHESKDKDAAEKVRADMKALFDSRPKMPEELKKGLFDPKQVEAQIRGVLKGDQVATFDANVKKLKEMKKKFEENGPPMGKHRKGGPEGHKGGDKPADDQ